MGSTTCRRCQHEGETPEHLFRECPTAKETWESLGVFWPNTEASYVKNSLKELDGVKTNLPARQITNRWVAPTGSRVKINFDAAFNKQRNKSCSGMVVGNEKRDVICFTTVFHSSVPSLFAAEALAGFQAIHLGLFLHHRESNQVAHFIATEGLKNRENSYLVSMVFSGAEDAVLADRKGLECM
ncbi:hypothetical protein GOBAR_AA07678 [Gossypium barbadense]|uniref:RNase H type-1 domain-containing protein n=1 Tax=Gossypium barbadense TaxID=3634 RepID=A0A2P5YBI3_GOSBA|nr:hypothetical protein GOBAR_AA07678 [Gossypium barbadense]